MIKKIDRIRNLRIFRDFKWTNQNEFGQYNLFFGLNGSGKTTLSNLFDILRSKDISQYSDSSFSITTDTQTITNINIDTSNENIYVFNKTFIEENLKEFSNLKGIVYISEKNINSKKNLDEKNEEKKKRIKELEKANNDYEKINKNFEQITSSAAKNIKEEFHIIGGIGNIYSNYNRTVFLSDIEEYNEFINNPIASLDLKKEIQELKELLKDDIKSSIEKIIFNDNDLENNLIQIKKILKKNIEKPVINNLGEKVFEWLSEGYLLHKDDICIYCGNIISKERQNELKKIFNTDLEDIRKSISESINYLTNTMFKPSQIKETDFYKKYQKEIGLLLSNLNSYTEHFNNNIENVINILQSKNKNPYNNIEIDIDFDSIIKLHKNIKQIVYDINQIIDQNNSITKTYEKTQQDTIKRLKLLFVYENYIKYDIRKKRKELKDIAKNSLDTKSRLDILNNEISNLENELIDVVKAGNVFNNLLAQFLGRDEIQLSFDKDTKGYKIIRKEDNSEAKNLSEGEKTAIAFIYFLTKVKENDNKIENSIIVFDDPISSMDSNHIFNAYAFISSYFDNAKQLFVLTHNFTFFKLIRRHFCKEKKSPNNMYIINNKYISMNDIKVRIARIENMPKSLLQASSEYPYLISRMLNFIEIFNKEQNAELNEILNIANISRKVVENFCSFKVPHLTNNLRDSIIGLYKCNKEETYELSQEEVLECERIYKFINSFSHENTFLNDEDINSLLGESKNVVQDIIKLLKSCDISHFKGIEKQIATL